MSTDPERAYDEGNLEGTTPEGDDPLVSRLRSLRWPTADDETRERALERFRQLVSERGAKDAKAGEAPAQD